MAETPGRRRSPIGVQCGWGPGADVGGGGGTGGRRASSFVVLSHRAPEPVQYGTWDGTQRKMIS